MADWLELESVETMAEMRVDGWAGQLDFGKDSWKVARRAVVMAGRLEKKWVGEKVALKVAQMAAWWALSLAAKWAVGLALTMVGLLVVEMADAWVALKGMSMVVLLVDRLAA